MFKIKSQKLDVFLRYLLALAMLAIAVIIRFWLLPIEYGYPTLTIFPATILCFLLFGFGPGILVTLLSSIVIFYFFVRPFNSFEITEEAVTVLPVYLVSGLMLGRIVKKSQDLAVKLQLANEKLSLNLNAQRRFIENAAHQLRTPLAGLKLQADNALSTNNLEMMKLALAQIISSTDRAAHLITQLLVLARSDAVSQSPKDFKIINLTKLTRECCMDWVPKALASNMELGFEAPTDPLLVEGEETLLCELLSNLLDNAVRYGKAGGQINVKIEINARGILIIEDDGSGIQSNEVDKVFERFYRISDSPGEGCGLGLAIVKEIADLHAAQISIGSSSFGRGTRIEIAFAKNVVS